MLHKLWRSTRGSGQQIALEHLVTYPTGTLVAIGASRWLPGRVDVDRQWQSDHRACW